MTKKKRLMFISALTVLVIALFLSVFFLNFHISESETTSRLKASAYSSMDAEFSLSGKTYFYSEGGEEIGDIFDSNFVQRLDENSPEVLRFANLKDKYNGTLLAVSFIKEKVNYNPFFPSSEIDVMVYYSLTGNSSYFDGFRQSYLGGNDPAVFFKTTQGPRLIKQGLFTYRDRTRGFVSLPAYKKKLGEELAQGIYQKIMS